MITKPEIEQFYKDVDSMALKFPVAAIADATSESKGNVSKILGRKLVPSESFLKRFYAKFPKSSKKVSPTNGESWNGTLEEYARDMKEWQISVDATLSILTGEIVVLLSQHYGKTVSSVLQQLRADIQSEIKTRLGAAQNAK